MKMLFFLSLIFVCQFTMGQSKSDTIYFYGCDITKAKITDPRRAGNDLSRYMLEVVGFINEEITVRKINKWFSPKPVAMKRNMINEVNRHAKTENLFYPNYLGGTFLTPDTIEKILKSYPIKQMNGTGFIVIVEFLRKDRKSVSGHGCLFDVATRKIIYLSEKEVKDNNSYNSFRDYWVPTIGLIKEFCTEFSEK